MKLEDITLEVRDRDMKRVGLILPEEATFTIRADYCNVGQWEVSLALTHPMVPHLRKPGSGITVTGPTGLLLSGPMVQATSKGSMADPEGMVTFKGVSDEIVLDDALAYPVPENPTMEGQAARTNDDRTGAAETVMHQFVNANIGPGAPAVRRAPYLTMGTDAGRGGPVRKTARFPKLGTLLREVSALSGIGFRVAQRGNARAFETYVSADRRKTIRMDLRNSTLASYEAITAGAAITHAIVGGSEAGTNRTFVERTSEDSLAQAALWGRRKERFLDRRAEDEVDRLQSAADEVLKKEGGDQSVVKFVPMDEETMRFGVDWNLGDVVTAVVEGYEVPSLVTAVILKVDSNGVRVACALGNLDGTDFETQVRSFVAGADARLSALERTAEQSALTTERLPEVIYGGFPGEVRQYAGTSSRVPAGWLICDGRALSRTTYARLFDAIGTYHGAGDGSTTFNIPDYRGRGGMGLDGSQTEFNVLGKKGGAKTHTLTVAEMPSHTHTQNPHTHNVMGSLRSDGTGAQFRELATATSTARNDSASAAMATTATNQNTGGGGAHNNLQPYIAVYHLIKT